MQINKFLPVGMFCAITFFFHARTTARSNVKDLLITGWLESEKAASIQLLITQFVGISADQNCCEITAVCGEIVFKLFYAQTESLCIC
ncbi:hypothetical protein SAMN05661044_02766 [Olivibacter domesticus]|uniref:Uncharacterized protein n=1 Tax=Olivibacter domesticus TaxID=407022 RepID=A0A1H7QYI8_OLID1|nr:hypothetical protein SAMN05661044_02766 [Olivibacter domesticus]